MTVVPTFTAPPTPPSRDDPDEVFVPRSNAFVAWLVVLYAQLVAFVAWMVDAIAGVEANSAAAQAAASTVDAAAAVAMAATDYIATSATPLTLDAGIKILVLTPTDGSWAAEREVALIARENIAARMFGYTAGYDPATGTLTVNVPVTAGAVQGAGGPYDDWLVMAGEFFTPAASVTEIWAGESAQAAVTALNLVLAAAFGQLLDAPTIAWDAKVKGFNVYEVLGGNRIQGAPSNLKDGLTYSLYIKQPAAGGPCTLSWHAIFDWGVNGPPTLSTSANKVDQAWGQYSALTGKLHMNFRKSA